MDVMHFDKISCKNANICNSTAIEAETKSLILGYLKDSNAAAHSFDTGITFTVRLKRIENGIEWPIYMLERVTITISL